MKSYSELIRTDLDTLRKILKSLSKYPSNPTYKEHERTAKLELDKDYKRLLKFVPQSKVSSGYVEYIKKLHKEIKIINSDIKPKNRLKNIDNAMLYLNSLEIFEEGKPGEINTTSILPDVLVTKLGNKFQNDNEALNFVWGKSGNCTAFVLRRIVEKAIFHSFARNQMIDKLRDTNDHNKFIGLNGMIEKAKHEQRQNGLPFLTPQTADKLQKIKYLGDTAAHDFLTDIYCSQIQKSDIDAIVIALGELL